MILQCYGPAGGFSEPYGSGGLAYLFLVWRCLTSGYTWTRVLMAKAGDLKMRSRAVFSAEYWAYRVRLRPKLRRKVALPWNRHSVSLAALWFLTGNGGRLCRR